MEQQDFLHGTETPETQEGPELADEVPELADEVPEPSEDGEAPEEEMEDTGDGEAADENG